MVFPHLCDITSEQILTIPHHYHYHHQIVILSDDKERDTEREIGRENAACHFLKPCKVLNMSAAALGR